MKKCSRCQAENFEDQKFCNLCGRELTPKVALDLYGPPPPQLKSAESGEPKPEDRAYKHFLAAKEHIARRDLDGAVRSFEAALSICPDDPMIQRLLAKTREARRRAVTEGLPRGKAPVAAGPPPPAAPPPQTREARAKMDARIAPSASLDFSIGGVTPGRPATTAPLSDDPGRTSRPRERAATPPPPEPPARQARATPAKGTRDMAAAASTPTGARALKRTVVEPDNDPSAARPSPHTGRFLELYSKAPALSPAMALDGRMDDGAREVMVNLLILGGFLIFGFLLLM